MDGEQVASSLTFPARVPDPHLHLDNRALMVHGGSRTLRVGASSFPLVFETLQLIAQEGRASRSSGQLFAGGFTGPDGARTLYFGIGEDFVCVEVDAGVFDELRRALQHAHQRQRIRP